ncbi:MAG: bis(5'-nucleosyl)-tetraphosphatase (symmetrical) YqeK [Fusobacterium sp.]|uniref:bis(5'-nucleosyl)-tetraphosphatase (symmetrical) YqeK n=1 Tax=Fusobacterium sp. TaxID=68766 RepID=UPI0026DAD40D|nr:bis(5'-nucleosyl)-tetraphosphatase (symmetrical) YqeK [Fusobacterium sp.]MDO4690356.1 bis(5'-nucleosyl)-tetraphosphatase (symmetrical) YqeK [Fusobacterium sp.]
MEYSFKELSEIIKLKLSPKRFKHTMSVVDMSVKLAKNYGANIEKCKIAALLHDACKEMNVDEMKKICKENFMMELSEEDLENTDILHSFVASYWVKKNFNIEDEEILKAIKNHTLGNKNMGLVEKIVYIADAIEMGRNYPGLEEIRDLTFENLDRGILLEAEKKESYLKKLGKKSHKNTKLMEEDLLKNISIIKEEAEK